MLYQVLVLLQHIVIHSMMVKDDAMVGKASNSQVSKWVSNEDGRVLNPLQSSLTIMQWPIGLSIRTKTWYNITQSFYGPLSIGHMFQQ